MRMARSGVQQGDSADAEKLHTNRFRNLRAPFPAQLIAGVERTSIDQSAIGPLRISMHRVIDLALDHQLRPGDDAFRY